MIVFTLTNQINNDVWVGTTRESSAERFEAYKEGLYHGIKHPFYKDLRDFGVDNFVLDDFAVAEDRDELKELFDEAIDTYEGKSLIGVKTVKTSIVASKAPAPKKVATRKTAPNSASSSISKAAAAISQARSGASVTLATSTKTGANGRPVAQKVKKEKLSTGRTGNAKREKAIKEAIMAEKAEREADKAKKVMEEADAMKAILARLDSRGSTLKKR